MEGRGMVLVSAKALKQLPSQRFSPSPLVQRRRTGENHGRWLYSQDREGAHC